VVVRLTESQGLQLTEGLVSGMMMVMMVSGQLTEDTGRYN